MQVVRQCRVFATAFAEAVTKEKAVRELLAALSPTNTQMAFARVNAADLLTEEYVFKALRSAWPDAEPGTRW